MIISRLRRNAAPAYAPTLYGNPMERVSVYEYLGVIITDNLSWSAHIDEISNKAKKIIGLIYCQFYAWSPPAALLQLHTSLVQPHLEYATQVWNTHLVKGIRKLEDV